MQHFHLGAQLELSDACRVRVKRTGELLYAIHRSDQGVLYLIAILIILIIGDRPRFPISNEPCPSREGQGFYFFQDRK